MPVSNHFTLNPLIPGVYACIAKPGGAAYSNAGIIDLGDRTVLVDSFDTMAAGRDLRQAAETLLERPVETIVLTHAHSDHWIGASAFDASTTLLSSEKTRRVCLQWGEELLQEYQNPAEWEEWLVDMEQQLQTEHDERRRATLEGSIIRTRYVIAEMADFQPRYADQTFEHTLNFQGSRRFAELRSFGRGHSEEDAALLLLQDRIAFIGDIGFFDSQPFMGFCDIDLYRQQLLFFRDAGFEILVPGHGPVGGKADIVLEIKYFDVLEELVGNVVQRGGSFDEALRIKLPEPFNKWMMVGMGRFDANVRFLFSHLGGELPEGS